MTKIRQNRPAPAYIEYAASTLSNVTFRTMCLESRGLLYTLKCEYWVGNPLPADPYALSEMLRLDQIAVKNALEEMKGIIRTVDGLISIPELDDYREYLSQRRKAQSDGGRKGAEVARLNAKSKDATFDVVPLSAAGNPRLTSGCSIQDKKSKYSLARESPVNNSLAEGSLNRDGGSISAGLSAEQIAWISSYEGRA